jgi:heparin binding hemagglutinin HbhA
MPTNNDVRKYTDTVVEQSKAAFTEARKPLLAWVGATDLAYDRLRSQLKELPTETQARVKKLQERAQGGVSSLDPVQVSAHLRQALESYAAQTREAYDSYREQAREQYETLSHRGELVVRRLRRRPELRAAFDRTEKLLGRTEKLVEEAEESITLKPAGSSTSSTQARKAPARKPPARKATQGDKA